MKKLLFISFHRIGVLLPSARSTSSFEICVEGQVRGTGYIEHVESKLADVDIVFAYAGVNMFEDMVALAARHPGQLRLVLCDCDQARRRNLLTQYAIDPTTVYWTTACGGQTKMGELFKYVIDNDLLPIP